MEALRGSARSTNSSGRSEDGKNCCGTSRIATMDSSSSPTAAQIVSHRERMAPVRSARYLRMIAPGSAWFLCFIMAGSRETPINGAKITATIQDASRAMATTAKIENVYSPAALFAKPIGTKPATVTSVPVSIGNAVEV